MICLLLTVLATIATITNAAYLRVMINQPNAVIDANPTINFSEIQFFKNGAQVSVPNANMVFREVSSGYPASLCNDGITTTGTGPYNLCKSSNADPTGQSFLVFLLDTEVDQMKIYNAYGYNNPAGQDVGKRIEGATLTITSLLTDDVVFTYTFGAPFQSLYTLSIPTPAPTLQPVSSPPVVTAKPTFTPAPNTVPITTPKPTSKPSVKPIALMARSNAIPVSEALASGASDDMATDDMAH